MSSASEYLPAKIVERSKNQSSFKMLSIMQLRVGGIIKDKDEKYLIELNVSIQIIKL